MTPGPVVLSAPLMAKLLLPLLAVVSGCTSVAAAVGPEQRSVAPGTGIAIGRLGFVARRKMALQQFRLAAVQVPDGDRFWIHASPGGEASEAGSFFVTLPPGRYRLTEWAATAADSEWGGEDAGLAIEVVPGQVVCVGALYLHPRERQLLQLEKAEDPPAVVRDECDALGEMFRQRSPRLARAAVVRVAQLVSRRRS